MHAFRVIILENDTRQARLLRQLLQALNTVCIEGYAAWRDVPNAQYDLVLCGHTLDVESQTEWLRKLASWTGKSPAAIAFVGEHPEIGFLETWCQRLGLRYLGYFPQAGDDLRLASMIPQIPVVLGHAESTTRIAS